MFKEPQLHIYASSITTKQVDLFMSKEYSLQEAMIIVTVSVHCPPYFLHLHFNENIILLALSHVQ